MIILGIPVLGIILFQKSIAVSIAESSLKQGMKIGDLEYLSTTTRQALKLAAPPGDRDVTQSMCHMAPGTNRRVGT